MLRNVYLIKGSPLSIAFSSCTGGSYEYLRNTTGGDGIPENSPGGK